MPPPSFTEMMKKEAASFFAQFRKLELGMAMLDTKWILFFLLLFGDSLTSVYGPPSTLTFHTCVFLCIVRIFAAYESLAFDVRTKKKICPTENIKPSRRQGEDGLVVFIALITWFLR